MLLPQLGGDQVGRRLAERVGARTDLERYLALVPNAPEAETLRARVDVIRAQAARIN